MKAGFHGRKTDAIVLRDTTEKILEDDMRQQEESCHCVDWDIFEEDIAGTDCEFLATQFKFCPWCRGSL